MRAHEGLLTRGQRRDLERDLNDDTKRASGYWKPTRFGIDFVHGRAKIPSRGYFYNRECLGLDKSKLVTIQDVLRKKFDYSELIADIAATGPDFCEEDGEREQGKIQ